MSYFRELPNLEYLSPLNSKGSSFEYIAVKNLFRRVKLFDWIKEYSNTFLKIQIGDYERPDIIAEEYYGSSSYDWVVMITADITNLQAQWPLSNHDLNDFVEEKYGLENVNDIHHYETLEVRDDKNRLILPKGKVVDSDFKINPPDGLNSLYYTIVTPYETRQVTNYQEQVDGIVVGVSNWEYEVDINESKRTISILKPSYLQQFLNDMRKLVSCQKSTEFVNIKTSKINKNQTI